MSSCSCSAYWPRLAEGDGRHDGLLRRPVEGRTTAATERSSPGVRSWMICRRNWLRGVQAELFAGRAETDADNLMLLYRQPGFTAVDEGLDLAEEA